MYIRFYITPTLIHCYFGLSTAQRTAVRVGVGGGARKAKACAIYQLFLHSVHKFADTVMTLVLYIDVLVLLCSVQTLSTLTKESAWAHWGVIILGLLLPGLV